MRTLSAALLAVLLACSPALAQDTKDHLGLSAIYAADIFQKSLAVVGKPRLVTEGQEAPPSPAVLEALTFKPSTEVERATRHKLLASLLETTNTRQVQEQIRQSIGSDDLWRQFAAVIAQANLSTRNLADVTAAYYIILWEVVNSNDANSGAAADTTRAVRNSIAEGLAADGRFARMSDDEKQEAASVMAYMAAIAADSANELNRTGNADALVRLRTQVHDCLVDQGVDLDRLRLTSTGFAYR
jgi:Family of unknown function (DUF6683)